MKYLESIVITDVPLTDVSLLQRDIFVITKSIVQYNFWKKTEEYIKEGSEYEGSFVVFDDMLDYNQKVGDPFLKEPGIKI